MLSPGRWHEAIPRETAKNLRWRLKVREAANLDPVLQRDEMAICGEDILYWINTYVWTYNPRTVRRIWPFCTFDFQDGTPGKRRRHRNGRRCRHRREVEFHVNIREMIRLHEMMKGRAQLVDR